MKSFLLLGLITGLAGLREPAVAGSPLRVSATTTIAGDIVRRIGGDTITLTVLMPPDTDPHAWSPRPADVARLTQADLIFINGLGLEQSLERVLRMPEIAPRIRSLSEGIEPRRFSSADAVCGTDCAHGHGRHAKTHTGHADADEEQDGHPSAADPHRHAHGAGVADPHVWMDPHLMRHWAQRVERVLADRRPAAAADLAQRRDAFDRELDALDAWIRVMVDRIPPERRVLVSDHESIGYFADRYGFRLAGAIIPGLSTLAQPSARDLARLETRLREEGIRSVFVGMSANPVVARRVASDVGIRVVRLHTDSLTPPGGPAGDYIAFMRTNVQLIVDALQ